MRRPLVIVIAALAVSASAIAAVRTPESAVAASGPRFGVYKGSNPAYVQAFEAWVPRQVEVLNLHFDKTRGWNGWIQPHWLKDFQGRDIAALVPPFPNNVSGSLEAAARGDYDAYYAAAARNLISYGYGDAHIILAHEFNGDWYPWTATNGAASTYIAAWRRFVTVFRSQTGAAFKFNWTLLIGRQQMSDPTAAYPGDEYVDIIGMDVYDQDWEFKPSQGGDWYVKRWNKFLTMPYGLNWLVSFAKARNKGISLPEWGLTTVASNSLGGGDNPYFVQALHDWMHANGVVYHAYHDSTWYDGDHFLEGNNFPNAAALYRQLYGVTDVSTTTPTTASTTTTTMPSVTSSTSTTIQTTTTTAPSSTTSSDSPTTSTTAPSGTSGTRLRSDEFTGASLNSAVWRYINPLNDTLPSMDGSALRLRVTAGRWHVMNTSGNRTARVVQSVEDCNFKVEVKFNSGVASLAQMQGLLVEESSQRYVAFEFRHEGKEPAVRVLLYQNGYEHILDWRRLPSGDGPLWMRVERTASTFTLRWSRNGRNFSTVSTREIPMRVTTVGVYSGNNAWGGLVPPAHEAVVDYFRAS
jgi:hypothetical protein